MPALALILFYSHRKEYDPEEKLVYMEFFADLKNTSWARAYTAALLIRRVSFVAIVIFMSREVDRTIIYCILLSIQIPYLAIIVSP